MPPKRQHIAKSTSKSRRVKALRVDETQEQRAIRLTADCSRHSQSRAAETQAQRITRQDTDRSRHVQSRAAETQEQRVTRQDADRPRHVQSRAAETQEQRITRQDADRQCHVQSRAAETQEQRVTRQDADRQCHVQSRVAETQEQRITRQDADRPRHVQSRAAETQEQRITRQDADRSRHDQSRAEETQEQRVTRQDADRQCHVQSRAAETQEQRVTRQDADRSRHVQSRAAETQEQRITRQDADRPRHVQSRAAETQEQRITRQDADRPRHVQSRAAETQEQRVTRQDADRQRHVQSRAAETQEQRVTRQDADRPRHVQSRAAETQEQRVARQDADRSRHVQSRAAEANELRQARIEAERSRAVRNRRTLHSDLKLGAFHYNVSYDYSLHPNVDIGKMDTVCVYCTAMKFKNETPRMCCANGKVKLPLLRQPPEPLLSLFSGDSSDSKHFLNNIRKYNSSFQMTSFGATKIVQDTYMPTFKIQGQIYHRVGSLLPVPDVEHKFLQIYFMGDEDLQIDQRCNYNPGTKRHIISSLQSFFHQHNSLIQLFRTAIDNMPEDDFTIILRADKTPVGEHSGRFNVPTINEVAIVMVGEEFDSRDIILHRRNNTIQRVAETHRSYDALQYPIIFWEGEDGYHFNIKKTNPSTGEPLPKKVSAMNYYAYSIMIRQNQTNHTLKCRQLFHQYVVDMYAKIETERLLYIRLNQKSLRSEEYIHLRDAIANDGNLNEIGKMVILPATFTGSPRHMHEYAQDAMTYVRSYGRPDLFITFTCNPAWNEIKYLLLPGQVPSDRHDITARIFKQKLTKLMDLIVKNHIYGETRCYMYSIEWQKRGLPHAHILIWLKNKIQSNQIDDVICAEIPNKDEDPLLYDIVTKNMIHGPCGAFNPQSPCMIDGKCSKMYPRELIDETRTGNDGYPQYRRRKPDDGGHTAIIRMRNADIEIDNRWIVPFSPLLSKAFQAHINVEYCNSVKSIKYICKYVNKGSDMAVFDITDKNASSDEVTQFQMGRYISSNEAVWRILSFPIHSRHPNVVHLSVHLENGQRVYFTANTTRNVVAASSNTTLTAFFSLCQEDAFAATLLYAEVPKYYIWNATSKKFKRRKQGIPVEGYANVYASDALGRVYTVHPNNAECYYLRMLLINVKGPTSFANLKTVDGVQYQTYRECCQKLQLLQSDQHWETTLMDACVSCHPRQIRILFAIILTTCSPSNPKDLWEKFKEDFSEDILYHIRTISHDNTISFSPNIFNEALIKIEDICLTINNKTLLQLGMVSPQRLANDIYDRDLLREQQFNVDDMRTFGEANLPLLVTEQKLAYDTILNAVLRGTGGLFFLDAPGGTGKTFLISLILAHIRTQNGIALAIASSGIASTLLDGGRTAHSALKLPLNMRIVETPTCNIAKGSGMAKVLQTCKIIIWDECTMAHKKSIEALDRTLKDLRENSQLFGGALILLAGDFLQTLPIIPKSTPADELNACLKASHLWRYVQKLTLTTNMRVHLQRDALAATFSKQLLDIGNGKIPVNVETKCISLPLNFCVIVPSIEQLIKNVFPQIAINYKNHQWLCERAILAAKNNDVNEINFAIQEQIPGNCVTYKSIDTVMSVDEIVNYPIEFLNSLDLPGVPPHILSLKIGTPIILLRNINPPRLCNGTRLAVKKLMPNVIEATILNGKSREEHVLIPRIPIIPTDMAFDFKRLQFPIRLAFSMTINKAQGQSLQVCGLNLENPCFSHGQLYVACSRVGQPKNLFILAEEGKTKNIVYPKALQ